MIQCAVNKEERSWQQNEDAKAEIKESKEKSPDEADNGKEGSAELKGEAANEDAEHGHPPGASGT